MLILFVISSYLRRKDVEGHVVDECFVDSTLGFHVHVNQ